MSDSHGPPPEVPDEFAAAYRAAYDEAMRSSVGTSHRAAAERPARGRTSRERSTRGRPTPGRPGEARPGPWPALRGAVAATRARARERRWLVPLVAAVAAVVLVLGAYLLGRAFAGDATTTASTVPTVPTGPDGRAIYAGDTSGQGSGQPAETGGTAWHGDVVPVEVARVRASCTAPPGRDSGGERVTYAPRNAVDGDDGTAWRCRGEAHGERLVLRLPGRTALGEIGLVPGYAKTDPVSGVDRYAQNNRITKVRWTIGDITVEQTLSGDPGDRSVQLLRIPRTTASRVTLEVLAVDRGQRNTTAISEVRLAEAVG
jgi:hypothetical protein